MLKSKNSYGNSQKYKTHRYLRAKIVGCIAKVRHPAHFNDICPFSAGTFYRPNFCRLIKITFSF